MRLPPTASALLIALVLVAPACDRRDQQQPTTDARTTVPADPDTNRSPDRDAAVTARDVDGDRSSAPPAGTIEQRPRDGSDTSSEPQPPSR